MLSMLNQIFVPRNREDHLEEIAPYVEKIAKPEICPARVHYRFRFGRECASDTKRLCRATAKIDARDRRMTPQRGANAVDLETEGQEATMTARNTHAGASGHFNGFNLGVLPPLQSTYLPGDAEGGGNPA